MKRRYFPAALNVRGKRCLVIGHDDEAKRKAARLVDAGADVTVQSSFRDGDVTDQFLVILTIKSDPDLSARVAAACRSNRVLLSAIDQPELCDVVHVSIFERGHLQIAISTDGHAPALAKRIRKGLEASLEGEPIEAFLDHLAQLRQRLEREIADPAERRKALIEAVAGFALRAEIDFPPEWKRP